MRVGNVEIGVVPLPAVRAKEKSHMSRRDGHQRLSSSNSAAWWSGINKKRLYLPL